MRTQEGLNVRSIVGVRAHTLRTRRRKAAVVCVDNCIVIRAKDGEELGVDDGFIFIIAALEFGVAVVGNLWSRSV